MTKEERGLIDAIKDITAMFKRMIALFFELDKAVDKRDVGKVNKVVEDISELTKSISEIENLRVQYTKSLCEKHHIKESASELAIVLGNEELSNSLNDLVKVINELIMKRQYTMNVLRANLDYLTYSIDFFKKLLNFGNYNEKGMTDNYINLLDQQG